MIVVAGDKWPSGLGPECCGECGWTPGCGRCRASSRGSAGGGPRSVRALGGPRAAVEVSEYRRRGARRVVAPAGYGGGTGCSGRRTATAGLGRGWCQGISGSQPPWPGGQEVPARKADASHASVAGLGSTAVTEKNCDSRASRITRRRRHPPSYHEALLPCLAPTAITRSRLPFDRQVPWSARAYRTVVRPGLATRRPPPSSGSNGFSRAASSGRPADPKKRPSGARSRSAGSGCRTWSRPSGRRRSTARSGRRRPG